ncbi:MAG: hypothetical protein R3236_02165, partial [Phycisphaeraceae bacterium]|nr:hypothetical protein [Phycisphaeraceae bacterium]
MGLRITGLLLVLASTGWAQGRLVHAPAPPDNPLTGLVPYLYADGADRFPHSLAFHYLPLKALMTGPNTFDFSPLEKHLNAAKKRRCHLIVRIYLEYPGKKSAVPDFLTEGGLKMITWT